tara:strand:+ start:34 stop:396 length:363 start_codon:yes stop_codon:yes gene_type:complete
MENQSIGIVFALVYIAVAVFYVYCFWKLFEKAGRPGWESIIPIYSSYIMITKLAKLEWWYLLLIFIPLVNIFVIFKIYIEIAKNFGKSTMYGVGLVFIGFILIPMLALGEDPFIEDSSEE